MLGKVRFFCVVIRLFVWNNFKLKYRTIMEKLFYQLPELQCVDVAIERGFAQTSNVENPEEKPTQPW